MHTLSLALLALLVTLGYGEFITPGVRVVNQQRPKRQFVPSHGTPIAFPVINGGNSGMSRPLFEPFAPSVHPEEGDDGVLELPEDLDLNAMDLNSLSLLNAVDNITAFADLFGIALPKDKASLMGFGPVSRSGISRGVAENLEFAKCKPELRTVKLNLPVESNTLFYPSCVRLEQCGGCCHGSSLTCRPTVTKVVTVKVMKLVTAISGTNTGTVERSTNNGRRQTGRRRGRRRRRENIPSFYEVEAVKHVECECGCKVQEQDCNPAIHNYMEGECACVCKRRDEKQKCEAQHSIKYWDSDSCACYCRRDLDCSTGEYFSQESCRCEREARRIVFPLDTDAASHRRGSHRRRPQRVPLQSDAEVLSSSSASSRNDMLLHMLGSL